MPIKICKFFALLTIFFFGNSNARGVSPYLPINLAPSLQASIERAFLLADQPVMTKPIALAQVLDALPAACTLDQDTCLKVRTYLSKFMKDLGMSEAVLQLSSSSNDSEKPLPNQHSSTANDNLTGNISAFYQPSDYLIFNLGASVNSELTPNATYLSAGWSIAQLDIGYRDIWLSAFSGHSTLLSTEAQTMPSISISNYEPIGPLNLQYEVSLSRMSKSEKIRYLDRYTTGYPNLAGLHLQAQPLPGYAISLNRLMQYGGGERGSSGVKGFLNAFLDPSHQDNFINPDYSSTQEFGNQAASIEAQLILPTRFPTALYAEYAGEDTSHGSNLKLGNVAASLGFRVSNWMQLLDLTAEISEWQNGWYVHHIYQDGLTNKNDVIGSWFGDQRNNQDSAGGSSWFLQTGWQSKNGYLQARYRTLSNQNYSGQNYHSIREVSLNYTQPWFANSLTGELTLGSDVFGKKYTRLSATYRFEQPFIHTEKYEREDNKLTELVLDAGIARISSSVINNTSAPSITTPAKQSPHAGIGFRRKVSNSNDIGMRLEIDQVNNRQLLSLRLLDWQHQFWNKFAFSAFLGGARYDWELPAYGYYGGTGIQWRNLLPNIDLNIDYKIYNKIARDKLLYSDPPFGSSPDMFMDLNSSTTYFSYKF